MPNWDPDLYLKFSDQRTRPAKDLILRINHSNPRHIVDLGCGPGNSTSLLHHHWPRANITGLDSSRDMIAAARQSYPDWNWVEGDAVSWRPRVPLDIVFSNAALQWVKHHEEVLPRLMALLNIGGVLAVQMPAHFNSPIHQLILQIAESPEWRHLVREATQSISVGRPSWYYDILQPYSSAMDIWETEYSHIMENHEDMLEWIRGTGLRPYLEALGSDAQRKQFEDRLLAGLKDIYPNQKDGRVLFPFRRLFIVAVKK